MTNVLRLVVERPEARPGEPFSCVLLLAPQDERVALARKLTVSLEWRASMKVTSSGGKKERSERQRAAAASWSPELPLRMEYNITLMLPDAAPFTYEGQVVAIEWFLVALLDVPRKQNGYVELPVRVVPRGST